MPIKKSINISELASKHPESVEILLKNGFHCIGCAAASYETLEQGAKAHGLNKKQLDKIVKEINNKIKR